MEAYEYIGWIPCVNGHLDFGLTKAGIKGGFSSPNLYDKKTVEKNFSLSSLADSHERAIVLQSKVDWRDSPSPDHSIGNFRVFVAGQVSPSSNMDDRDFVGHILIYPLCAEPDEKLKVRRVNAHTSAHNITAENVATRFPEIIELYSSPHKIRGLKSDCFVTSIKFKIRPNGLTCLKFNPNGSELDQRSQFLIARQAFYYLKYSVHSHRHHENKQDSLTTITRLDSHCGLRLVCQLKRELTNLGRIQKIDNRVSQESNTDGIIAYSKSLLIGLTQEKIISDQEAKTEEKRFNNIAASFNSQEDKIKQSDDKNELIKQKSKVWIGFSLIFLWGTANYLFSVPLDKKEVIPEPYFYLTPFVIFIAALSIYIGLKIYYKYVEKVDNLAKIYSIKYTPTLIKVGFLALIFFAAFYYEFLR